MPQKHADLDEFDPFSNQQARGAVAQVVKPHTRLREDVGTLSAHSEVPGRYQAGDRLHGALS